MNITVLKETWPGETRVALVPESAKRLVALGAAVAIERGLGAGIGLADDVYRAAGASVASDPQGALTAADLVLRVRPPADTEAGALRHGTIWIGHLDPFNRRALVEGLAQRGISAIAMEMVPRSSIAQKMDALSSQASLGGYVAVILAADRLSKVFPMMTTPAGTLQPSRVFVIGAGVAGLQAIATAKRLGARVEAFDTRPEVAEQVQSLGAKFVKIDLGDTGSTTDGYAKALTPEQIERQRQGMAKVCAQADVVITTAQVFGRKAPVIVTRDMVAAMRPGSLLVDMAVESGGNVEGSVAGQELDVNGVRLIGLANLPGRVAAHASQMYASNVAYMIEHFWDKDANVFQVRLEDDILKSCLVTHAGHICSAMLRTHYGIG